MKLAPFGFDEGEAVVTGAASGIGAAVAHELAHRGSRIVLVDRNADGLAEVAAAVVAAVPTAEVSTRVVDLIDPDAVDALGEELAGRDVRLLVNNAGVALAGEFAQVTMAEFEWLTAINFHAPVRLTHHLLPTLTARPGGHLVVVSSVFGLVGAPGNTAYCASKFALRGFAESLRAEIGQTTGVTVIHPGGIRTRIALDARIAESLPSAEAEAYLRDFHAMLTITPARAAQLIVDGVAQRRDRVLIGATAKLPDVFARITPTHSGQVLAGMTAATGRLARLRRRP